MTIQKIKMVFAGLMTMVFATSCVSDFIGNDDGSRPLNGAWGEILRHEGKENFDIVLDNNDTIRTINTSHINKEDTKTGTRIIFSATLYDEVASDPYKLYTGSLVEILPVVVEKPILLSWVNEEQHRIDSVGNDPLELTKISVSGKYLNVEFFMRQNDGSIKHTISFVVDDVSAPENGTLNITMRHNGNGDTPAAPYRNIMSCNIKEYMDPVISGSLLKVNLFYNSGGSEDVVKSVTWMKP